MSWGVRPTVKMRRTQLQGTVMERVEGTLLTRLRKGNCRAEGFATEDIEITGMSVSPVAEDGRAYLRIIGR